MINPDASIQDTKILMLNRPVYEKLKQMDASEELWLQVSRHVGTKPRPVIPKFKLPVYEINMSASDGNLVNRITIKYNSLPDDNPNCALLIDNNYMRPVSGTFARLFKAVLETPHKCNEELRVLTWLRIILMNYASAGTFEEARLSSPIERELYKSSMVFIKKVLSYES